MVTKSKGSTWDTVDNLRQINLLDYRKLRLSDSDWTLSLIAALVDVVSTGYPLLIPGGIYPVSPTVIPDGVTVFGIGTLKLIDGAFGPLLTLGNNTLLQDITIDGNSSFVFGGNWYPIVIASKTGISLNDIKILNALTDGVHISGAGSTDIRISGVQISNFSGSGITITSGSDIQIAECRIKTPANAASPGHGIALLSDGIAISDVSISQCHIRGAKGDGIGITGIGTRNITDVTIDNCHIFSSTFSGIRATFAERVLVSNSTCKNNLNDGIRLRGDVQFCRIANCSAVGNTSVGMEEVTSGASPNNNTFSFNVTSGNGNNTIIKVGSGSIIL